MFSLYSHGLSGVVFTLTVEFVSPVLRLVSGALGHVDLQEYHDPAADQALKRALTTETWVTRPRPRRYKAETLGPPTDDSSTDGLLKADRLLQQRAVQGRSTKSAACRRGLPAKDEVCLPRATRTVPPTGPSSGEGQASPPATRQSSQPSLCSPGPRPSRWSSRSCPGHWCSHLLRLRVVHRQHINASASSEAKSPQPFCRGPSPCSDTMLTRIREVDV